MKSVGEEIMYSKSDFNKEKGYFCRHIYARIGFMYMNGKKGLGVLILLLGIILGARLSAQERPTMGTELPIKASLKQCIDYAMHHFPALQQGYLDEILTNSQVQDKLSNWYPQLNLKGTFQHTFQRQIAVIGTNQIPFGAVNDNVYTLSLTQNIFSSDVLFAFRTRKLAQKTAQKNIVALRIQLIVDVSQSFYQVLRTEKQIDILEEDIIRLERSWLDASAQYQSGVSDNIDVKRARIALNNAKAQRKNAEAVLKVRYAILKERMGLKNEQFLSLLYDSLSIEQEAILSLPEPPAIQNRIEYQQLDLKRQIGWENLKYQKFNFLPTLSFNAQYVSIFQEFNNNLHTLYNRYIPYNFVNLQLNWPLFSGLKNRRGLQQSKWHIERIDYDIKQLKNAVNREYEEAIAAYQTDLTNYFVLKENLILAQEVYATIGNQYKAGTKTYLEVITAETDLRSARINYTDALFQLLSDKILVEKALGIIQ